jgi:hypothetical protein
MTGNSIFGKTGKVRVDGDGELLIGNERISRKDSESALSRLFGNVPQYFPRFLEEVNMAIKYEESAEPISKNYPTQQDIADYHRKRN